MNTLQPNTTHAFLCSDHVLELQSGDPTEIPPPEPEKVPQQPHETVPHPDGEPIGPDEPEQIPPLPERGLPSPKPDSPGQPMMTNGYPDRSGSSINGQDGHNLQRPFSSLKQRFEEFYRDRRSLSIALLHPPNR